MTHIDFGGHVVIKEGTPHLAKVKADFTDNSLLYLIRYSSEERQRQRRAR